MNRLIKRILKGLFSPIVRTRGPRGRIYLTFDDGPHPEYTPQILNILSQFGVKATFFMVGAAMKKYPEIVAQALAQGHTLGYHSYAHKHARTLSIRQLLWDIEDMNRYQDMLGMPIRLYRPPYGELSIMQILWCLMRRKKIIMWSVESMDSFTESSRDVMSRVSPHQLRDGDIVLFHDDTPVTIEALAGTLPTLRDAGFRFGVL